MSVCAHARARACMCVHACFSFDGTCDSFEDVGMNALV